MDINKKKICDKAVSNFFQVKEGIALGKAKIDVYNVLPSLRLLNLLIEKRELLKQKQTTKVREKLKTLSDAIAIKVNRIINRVDYNITTLEDYVNLFNEKLQPLIDDKISTSQEQQASLTECKVIVENNDGKYSTDEVMDAILEAIDILDEIVRIKL